MKMRPPAVPLISVDPYFSIWSMADRLPQNDTMHWTGKPHRMVGQLIVDGKEYLFMGKGSGEPMQQTYMDMRLLSTEYHFETEEIKMVLTFTAPLIPDNIEVLCRPVNYMHVYITGRDGKHRQCQLKLRILDEICLDRQFDSQTVVSTGQHGDIRYASVENFVQNPLCRSGDDIRIEWGRFLIATRQENAVFQKEEITAANGKSYNQILLDVPVQEELLLTVAYDDDKSLMYFGKPLDGYWKKYDRNILGLISKADREYDRVLLQCNRFHEEVTTSAEAFGGEQYKELVILSWRQTMAAHKAALGPNGELLFISKECFSDGDAATVDITYPSAPLFLLYNSALLKGMLLPIFTLAESEQWTYDCAPHDVGVYPLLNGQEYKDAQGNIVNMPVEECGNMIILTAAYVKASGDLVFAKRYLPLLEQWVKYLLENGEDPAYQLCTDDFAGRSAHNCNLTVKAIMGIASYGLLHGMLGNEGIQNTYLQIAQKMAASWENRARNQDGSYRMAFDQPDTFSLKYNMVWDVVFGTNLFSKAGIAAELHSYILRMNRYGMPLDNRADYTKSDWILWCATMCEMKEQFQVLIEPVWQTYNDSIHRVPMGDWYDSKTAKLQYYPDIYTGELIAFQNRTVQGAMLFPLLRVSQKLHFYNTP